MNRSGEYVRNMTGEAEYRSFRPAPLPPNKRTNIHQFSMTLLHNGVEKFMDIAHFTDCGCTLCLLTASLTPHPSLLATFSAQVAILLRLCYNIPAKARSFL